MSRMSSDAMTFTLPSPATWTGALPLPEMGVLQGTGPDTASFLHGQLSQDVVHLDAHQARLAAYCSAKGRMLASAIALKPQADTVWLLCDHSVLPALHKRLSMFVLRAKTALTHAGADLRVVGLVGNAAQALITAELPAVASPAPTAIAAPWPVQAWHGGQLVTLPTVLGVPRWLWVGPPADADALQARMPALPEPSWSWLDVMSAVPRIQTATADQFVPQMVNFELVGGVNFQKGCYPGQEVVARSQYRGTVKRRAVLVHSAAPLQAGQEVFADSDPDQPAGLVVQAAPIPASDGVTVGGAHSALIEVKLAALGTPVRAAVSDGPKGAPLTWAAMPYPLDVDEGA
jgi:tRNA-modifying protein YgfZ